MISIVIPTIKGREHWLERCLESYRANTLVEHEIKILRDYPNCNSAWNAALEGELKYDVIHLTADDIEAHADWDTVGLKALEGHYLPCPLILNGDGSVQSFGDDAHDRPDGSRSEVARIPLFRKEWVQYFYPFPEIQYMGDYWLTAKCKRFGIPTLVVRKFVFTHHTAPEGRLNTLTEDIGVYNKALRT